MNKINVMHLRSSAGFYGAEGVIFLLCKNINRTEFNSFLCCFVDSRFDKVALMSEAEKINIPSEIIKLSFRFDMSSVFKLIKILNKYNIEILHCHDYKANCIAFVASKLKRVKLITTLHGWTKAGIKLKFYEYIDSIIMKHFDKIIAVSEQIREYLLEKNFERNKITVIHNAVNADYFKNKSINIEYKKKMGIDETARVIGAVGRLSSEKGHKYLIEAIPEIIRVFPDAVFLIVGAGPDEKILKKLVCSMGLEKCAIFPGFVSPSEIKKIYSLIDIFVLPSLTEGICLALLEAMAMGISVVATNVGGNPEIIENGKTGFLISAADKEEISKAVIRLLSDITVSEAIAKAGQKFIRDNFTVSEMVKKTENLYKELAGK